MTEQALHILVVDDDMLARMTAAQCVKLQGHTASMATGGAQALEMLRSERYDLILLDLMMPDVDGFQVLTEMKQDPRLQAIPVLMVSGTDEARSIAQCIEKGAAGHLPKPLDSAQLGARINACLQ